MNSSRDITPRGRLVSPGSVTSRQRLQHSPSMLDIRARASGIPQHVKESIRNWLLELRLIRGDILEEFKDGSLLCELINRLEGKSEPIKGAQKNPKTKSSIQVNFSKAFTYLRNIEKFNSKYLWSPENMMEGDEEATYGMLASLKDFYSLKRTNSQSFKRMAKTPISTPRVFSAINIEPKHEDDTSTSKLWVKNLGLGKLLINENKHFLDDPCRNGILLYEIISKLEGHEVPGVSVPRSLSSAQGNIEKCLKFLYEKYPSLALKYMRLIDNICNGDSTIWKLIEELVSIPRNMSKVTSDLPYSPDQVSALQKSLVDWVSGVASKNFENFEDICLDMSNGILLHEIVTRCGMGITGIMKNPKTDKIKLGNIEKCLDALRRNNRMSQKFLWKTDDILEANNSVAMGLLEDLHMLYDGLPPRKRGPNYHIDGPYLGRKAKNDISPIRSIPLLLNKSFDSLRESATTRRQKEDILPIKKYNQAEDYFLDPGEFEWVFNIGINIQPFEFHCIEIEEFKSGVLLCQIVEKLERKSLSGVEMKPKSNAVALYNINKALKVLKAKPTFPSSLMFVEEDISKGVGESVRQLLRAIQKIYKQTIRSYMKFNNIEKTNRTYIG